MPPCEHRIGHEMKQGMVVSTFKTGLGQLLGLLLGAISVKLLAVLAGPAGVGLFSVLRHLQQTLSSVASVGGQNAVVQGLGSHSGRERQQFLLSSFYVFVFGSLLISTALLLCSDIIASWMFAGEHASAVRWLVIPVILGALLFYFRGVLIAEMQFGALALVNVFTGVGAVVAALPVGLAYSRGYSDFLVLLLVCGFAPGLVVAFFFVRRLGHFQGVASLSFISVTVSATVRFLKVALPSLMSSFLTLGSVLVVRAHVVEDSGLEGAGQFDAAWTISAMYLALFLASLQSYLLPELSQSDKAQMRLSLAKAFHFSLLIALPLITVLVVLKPLVVRLLFSDEFLPSLKVLRWVLLGDCVRVIGWIIATVLLARADMKGYVLAEGLWSLTFLLLSLLLLPYGIEWVGLAYLLSYIVYLALLMWRLWATHGASMPGLVFLRWLSGFALVAVSAWFCWDDQTLYSWHFVLILPAVLFSFLIMGADERHLAHQLLTQGLLKVCCLISNK